jgi:hypothetical protein
MSTCGKCKHWSRPGSQCNRQPGGGDENPTLGKCLLIESGEAGRDDKAIAEDCGGYYAVFRTRDDFGCTLFQAPDQPPQAKSVGFDTITELP